jgi:hypothetical protein
VELLQRDSPAGLGRRAAAPTKGAAAGEALPKRRRLEAPLDKFVTLDMYYFVTPDPF